MEPLVRFCNSGISPPADCVSYPNIDRTQTVSRCSRTRSCPIQISLPCLNSPGTSLVGGVPNQRGEHMPESCVQVLSTLSSLRISLSCDRQLISQSMRPAGSNGQSTIFHVVHCPSAIRHLDRVTCVGAASFRFGQRTARIRSLQRVAAFLLVGVLFISHPSCSARKRGPGYPHFHVPPGPGGRLFAPNPRHKSRYLSQRATTAQKPNKIKTPNRIANAMAISMPWAFNASRADTSALRAEKWGKSRK